MHLIFKAIIFFLLQVTITTTVSAENPEINVHGLTEELQNNVHAFLSLTQESCQSSNWRIKNLFAKSENEIGKALRSLGYYQPEVVKKLIFTDDCWQASFDVTAGIPVRVKTLLVIVQGGTENEPDFQKLLSNLPIKQGDILNHASYEKIKQDLNSLALELGYLNRQLVKKSLRVDPKKKQATIKLVLNSGTRHRFGRITIEQDVLSPDFVQRYITIKPDDNYSSKKLVETYRTLANSKYFSNVEVNPQMDNIENYKVPLNVNLTAKKRHDYNFGAGFDTDIGPLASIGYQNHRLNKKGHYLSVDTAISPVLSSAEVSYMIPFSQPRNDHVAVAIGYKYEQPDSFESHEVKLSLQYQHLYQNSWKQVLFLNFSYENFDINAVNKNTTLLVPGVHWQYMESNHALRPTQGYKLYFSLASAHESLISDVTFLQATAAAKLINALPWSARLITRFKQGATLTSDFESLPTSYRFYAGGTESIRGYEYKNLGPTDDKGKVIGGEMLTILSTEYEQFINEAWSVATFIDAGNAYNSNNIEIKTSAGVGIRWLSPIGPVRLDFAVPLSKSDSSFQFHFSAGPIL